MPKYSYKCDKCHYLFDRWHKSENRNKTEKCPECNSPAGRCFGEEIKNSKIDALMVDNVRWSWAMGINPDNPQEVKEARERHPGAVFNERGQMRIANRTEKLQRMKEAGMTEYNQEIGDVSETLVHY